MLSVETAIWFFSHYKDYRYVINNKVIIIIITIIINIIYLVCLS